MSDNDKELLALAAKAARLINPRYHEANGKPYDCGTGILHDTNEGRETHLWNPLTDDGDALRLAVKLGLRFEARNDASEKGVFVWKLDKNHDVREWSHASEAGSMESAARRAIVRAAAAIGKEMP